MSQPWPRTTNCGRYRSRPSPWVLVLHADATLQPHAIDCLQRYLRAHPQTIGGALGQRFIGQPIELLPIEILNDLRLLFTRTAFGDQAQFFIAPPP